MVGLGYLLMAGIPAKTFAATTESDCIYRLSSKKFIGRWDITVEVNGKRAASKTIRIKL